MTSRCNRVRRHVVTTFAVFAVAISPIAAGADDPATKNAQARPNTRPTPGLGLAAQRPWRVPGIYPGCAVEFDEDVVDRHGRSSRAHVGEQVHSRSGCLPSREWTPSGAATLIGSERRFATAGQGGRVQEFDWDGNLVWDFKFHDDKRVAHHAICRLPNGNILLIVWEIKTAE